MKQWAVCFLVCAALLASALQGCASSRGSASATSTVQIPEWANTAESATIIGKLTTPNGGPFTERVTATVKQGTGKKEMTVENGEYRITGLLAGMECSLAFTSKENLPIGKVDLTKLVGGDNQVDCTVDAQPGGKYRIIPKIAAPPGIGTGPTK